MQCAGRPSVLGQALAGRAGAADAAAHGARAARRRPAAGEVQSWVHALGLRACSCGRSAAPKVPQPLMRSGTRTAGAARSRRAQPAAAHRAAAVLVLLTCMISCVFGAQPMRGLYVHGSPCWRSWTGGPGGRARTPHSASMSSWQLSDSVKSVGTATSTLAAPAAPTPASSSSGISSPSSSSCARRAPLGHAQSSKVREEALFKEARGCGRVSAA